MNSKYGLVTKTKKGNWKPIWNDDDQGRNVEGGLNSDRDKVQRNLDWLVKAYPSTNYALIEVKV